MKNLKLHTAGLALAITALLTGCGGTTDTSDTVAPAAAVTTYKTPRACLQALNDAEQIGRISARFANTTSKLPAMILDAYKAGLYGDTALGMDVVDRVKAANAEMDGQDTSMSVAVAAFNAHKVQCRTR